MRRFRQLLSSRKVRILTALAFLAAGSAVVWPLLPRGIPQAGILVVDLRHALPDKAQPRDAGRRSVSAVDVLRALDAARDDGRITGLYLRVGGGAMPLAHAGEIADAVLRLRRAGKFAIVWSEGFTAANLSDRVLASAADEIWTPSGVDAGALLGGPIEIPPAVGEDGLWQALVNQASQRITASARAVAAAESVDALARTDSPPPPQRRRGSESRAEQAALAWGGADSEFVDLLSWRDALHRQAADGPAIVLVQAEGVLDILEGDGASDLAGPLAEGIRAAAASPRVAAIVVRISAVAASDEALALLVRAAEEARRGGTPVGISFGPLVPANAAALRPALPLSAARGALVIDLKPGARAAALAGRVRNLWRTSGPQSAANPAEAMFLESRTAIAAIGAGEALGMARDGLPEDGFNVLSGAGTERQDTSDRGESAVWHGNVGTLLELRDRLAADGKVGGRLPRLVSWETRPSVWTRTRSRLAGFWRRLTESAETLIPAPPPSPAED